MDPVAVVKAASRLTASGQEEFADPTDRGFGYDSARTNPDGRTAGIPVAGSETSSEVMTWA
jgi:hypothetical protein